MTDKKIILIVEDETPLLRVLADKLSSQGFEVLQAKDGEQGLEIAKEKMPDLILLDIIMPKMDGITMLKNLRNDSWAKATPVILLTNVDNPTTVAAAVENDMLGYLVKSDWKLEDVVRIVKEKLGISK